ncbi:MAG: Ldh family oxidoreductase [Alphaproteobacteria bacterium]|nr:Ldh family oxidoreductase [Alphaproteobacteria bacterium]
MTQASPDGLRRLVAAALERSNTAPANAASVADALVAAEIDGQKGHGLSRVPGYAAQARSGKVDGRAVPRARRPRPGAVVVDAADGFAFPAIDLAIAELAGVAPTQGAAAAAIRHSHHFGVAGHHAERLAERGLVALVLGNSPQAIAPWGGTRALFGTNPIAFAAPRRGHPPLVIDLSLSKVARGRIMVAAQKGEAIPEGWALDKDGRPTTDAKAALDGAMLPMGDAKGAALALMVEILAAALTASHLGFEASSFFAADGPPPRVGQFMLALDPGALSGGAFAERLETLLAAMLAEPGVRLPGTRRLDNRLKARSGSIEVDDKTLREIESLAR